MADKPLVVSFEAMQEGLRESERELRGLRVNERWARAEIAAVGKAIMLLHKIKECAEDELRSGSEGNRSKLQASLDDYQYQKDKALAFLDSQENAEEAGD